MKKSVFLLFLIISSFAFAQNQKAIAPTIVLKAPMGESVMVDGITLLFKEVISDSRCPENVNCVWAGEIKIYVTVTQEDFTEGKEITFGTLDKKSDPAKLLFESSTYMLWAEMVKPYPKNDTASIANDYVLLVRRVNKE